MNEEIQADDRLDEPDPIPASAQPGEARRPDRVRPAERPGAGVAGDDDGPASDESGGPTAPQRPPSDS